MASTSAATRVTEVRNAPAAAAVRAVTAGERPRPPSAFSRWSTATLLSLVFSARVGSPLTMMEPGPAERQGNA